MSAGPGPQAELIQRNQSAKGPDASQHSALFYLFQEVSKLASPVHSTLVGADSPGRWPKDAPPQGSLRAEEEETCCLERSDHSGSPHHWTGVEEQPGPVGHSPWKVLSLINLQCQRLLHHSDAEESVPRSSSPPLAMDRSSQAVAPCVPTGGATISTGVGSDPQLRVKEPSSLQSPSAGRRDGASQLHQEDKKEEEFSRNGASERSGQDTEHLPRQNIPHTTKAPSGGFLNNHLTHSSNTDAVLFLRKPELTLDYNANLSLPFAALRDPYSRSVPPSQPPPSTAHQCTSTQEGHPPVEHGGGRQGVTATKPPRKQPRPSRSVDIHDPDLQGVMFRMDPELDARRDQCRLLITSEFRGCCTSLSTHGRGPSSKRVRKPKARMRTSQKSVTTSSSDEETTSVSKDKICASCSTRKTPMWRNAEDGTPLCNACGIRYKKYRVRCVNCWHIPRKEGNSNSTCLKCGNFVRLTSAQL
ncbi:GATA-type zinc finger protein 1 isoform X2 [Takifugu rubripes]|nr:GATA-type zinc finger protein 1 isoform X2 [Takifugu rubripes]XP_029707098.1 GATA-type zinc finger protein 1 isoform X2 [Takifugu rubripes]XP_029707099.1 GATA-type zinc finger protein 1 isoform X2 [Takifugu rubripes]